MDHFDDFKKWVTENYRTYGGAVADVANMPAELANLPIRAATGKDFFRTFSVPQPSSRSSRVLREALPYASIARDLPMMAKNGVNMLMKNRVEKAASQASVDAGRRSFLKGAGATVAGGGAAAVIGKPVLRTLAKVGAKEADPTAALVNAHLDAARSHEAAAALHQNAMQTVHRMIGDGALEEGEANYGFNSEAARRASMQANEDSAHDLLQPQDEIDMGFISEDEAPDLRHLDLAREHAHDAESRAHDPQEILNDPKTFLGGEFEPEDFARELENAHADAADHHASASYNHIVAAHKLAGMPDPTVEEAIAIRRTLASPKKP
jgi:hypothetical protein